MLRPLDSSKFVVSTWQAQDSVAKGLWAPKSADGEVKAAPRVETKIRDFTPNMWAVSDKQQCVRDFTHQKNMVEYAYEVMNVSFHLLR